MNCSPSRNLLQKKIASMLDRSKIELIDMTNSIEQQMNSTTASLSEKMTDSAKLIQQQIESEVARFLQELSQVRDAALHEITSAAKGNLSLSKNADQYSDSLQDKSDPIMNESSANDLLLPSKGSPQDLSTVFDAEDQAQGNLAIDEYSKLDRFNSQEETISDDHKTRRSRKKKEILE